MTHKGGVMSRQSLSKRPSNTLFLSTLITLIGLFFGTISATAAPGANSGILNCPPGTTPQPQIYQGVLHCRDDIAEILVIDPTQVQFETVLAEGYEDQNGDGIPDSEKRECRDVNLPQSSSGPGCYDNIGKYPADSVGNIANRYIGKGYEVVIAFNTDYFDSDNYTHGPQGLVVKNGDRFDGRSYDDMDKEDVGEPSLSLSRNGGIRIGFANPNDLVGEHNDLQPGVTDENAYYNTVGGGPILVENSISVVTRECSISGRNCPSPNTKRARTAVGKNASGHLIIVVLSESNGLTLYELTDKMLSLGVIDAMNLDGGGSSQLWYNGSYLVSSAVPRRVAEGLLISKLPSSTYMFDIVNPDAYTCSQHGKVDFEEFTEGTNLSSGTIAGVQFTTTNGFSWLVGDFSTGKYNGKYPNGGYTSHGSHWSWLGNTQGVGRIYFPEGPASYFSLLTSANTPVSLEAYDNNNNLLATAGPSTSNYSTGHMIELKIIRSSADMSYVVVHDTGNYFLIDDVCTNAPGTPDTIKRVVDETYFMQTGQSVTGNFFLDFINGFRKYLHIVIGPFFSEVDLVLTRPDGSIVNQGDPGVTIIETLNQIEVSIDDATIGMWNYEINAIELEPGGESIRVVVDEQSIAPINNTPLANAGGPYFASEGNVITVDGTASSDPDNDTLNYRWTFGEGSVGEGQTETFAYPDNGSYLIVLNVTDTLGASDLVTTTATISNVAPSVESGLDQTIQVGEPAFLSVTFVDPGYDLPTMGTVESFTATVEWGDSVVESVAPTENVAPGYSEGFLDLSHVYTAIGGYVVNVCVTDDDSGIGCDSMTISVQPFPIYLPFVRK